MGVVILVTGGARAGKSRFALARARAVAGRRRFVATADRAASAADPEMARRVTAHRRERGEDFETVEAPAAPAAALREASRAGVVAIVLDDLTLWVANRLGGCPGTRPLPGPRAAQSPGVAAAGAAGLTGGSPEPDGAQGPPAGGDEPLDAEARDLAAALREAAAAGATVVVVTNEVGWGIVPAGSLARTYRDALGRVNQTVAAAADEVWLVVAGLSLRLK